MVANETKPGHYCELTTLTLTPNLWKREGRISQCFVQTKSVDSLPSSQFTGLPDITPYTEQGNAAFCSAPQVTGSFSTLSQSLLMFKTCNAILGVTPTQPIPPAPLDLSDVTLMST